MTDQVTIFNMVLDLLERSARVATLNDNNPLVTILNRNYPQARDETLEAHPWNFAMQRFQLAETVKPVFGWDRQYIFPSGALAVVPLRQDGEWAGRLVPHEVEFLAVQNARVILCDVTPPLKCRFIMRVTDTAQYSPLYVRALSANLALILSHRMTGKQSYTGRMERLFTRTIREARHIDAVQGMPSPPDQEDILEEML